MLTGKELGAAIEAARLAKGISKKKLADDFEVKPPSVQGWVNHGRIDKAKLMQLIAYFSDVVPLEHWGIDEQVFHTLSTSLSQRMKTAREHAGITQKQLAEAVNVEQPLISQLETGKTLKSAHIAQMAKACGVSAIWLASGKGEMLPGDTGSESNVEPGPPITSPWRAIPIVGTAQMGTNGYWNSLEAADGYIELPSRDRDSYALRLKGDSMAPAIKSGWIAVCEPNHRLVPLEYVMIRLQDGESMVKELLRATDEEVTVQSVNDAYGRRTIPVEQIETIHYVSAIVPPGKVMM